MTDKKKCQADWPFQHHLQTVLSHFTNSVFQSCQLVFITSPKKGRNNQLRESSFFLGVTADLSADWYWQRGLEWSARSQSIDLRLKTCCRHLIQSDMMPVACWSGGGGGQSPGRQSGWWDSMAGETTICRGEMCVSTHSPPFGIPRLGRGWCVGVGVVLVENWRGGWMSRDDAATTRKPGGRAKCAKLSQCCSFFFPSPF